MMKVQQGMKFLGKTHNKQNKTGERKWGGFVSVEKLSIKMVMISF